MTDKKEMAEIFNNYFSLIQNVGEEHDSVSDVAVNISVHPSIAVIRENVWQLSLSLIMSQWLKRS